MRLAITILWRFGAELACLTALVPVGLSEAPAQRIPIRDLRHGAIEITGHLGLPLGSPAEIEGVVVSVESKSLVAGLTPTSYRLMVDTVNGRKLDSPQKFSFAVESPHTNILGRSELELRELLKDLVKWRELSLEQAESIAADYTTVRRKLLVYETAEFRGWPEQLRSGQPRQFGHRPPFGFGTYLVVVGVPKSSGPVGAPGFRVQKSRFQVTAHDLENNRSAIVGDLDFPLGTPVEIEGVFGSARAIQDVNRAGEYLLVVDTIGGKKLDATKTFRFQVEGALFGTMANTEWEVRFNIESLVKEENSLSRKEGDKLFDEYTRIRRRLMAFESAAFSGIPSHLPSTVPHRSSHQFGIETFLVLLEEER